MWTHFEEIYYDVTLVVDRLKEVRQSIRDKVVSSMPMVFQSVHDKTEGLVQDLHWHKSNEGWRTFLDEPPYSDDPEQEVVQELLQAIQFEAAGWLTHFAEVCPIQASELKFIAWLIDYLHEKHSLDPLPPLKTEDEAWRGWLEEFHREPSYDDEVSQGLEIKNLFKVHDLQRQCKEEAEARGKLSEEAGEAVIELREKVDGNTSNLQALQDGLENFRNSQERKVRDLRSEIDDQLRGLHEKMQVLEDENKNLSARQERDLNKANRATDSKLQTLRDELEGRYSGLYEMVQSLGDENKEFRAAQERAQYSKRIMASRVVLFLAAAFGVAIAAMML